MIRNKGLEKITVEELVQEITPRGRATVPDTIKGELLERIRKFLSDQEEAEQVCYDRENVLVQENFAQQSPS